MMRFGVIRFHGSNCDRDCYHVVDRVLQQPVYWIEQNQKDLAGVDVVLIPGGFSYGDYLRAGAIAARTPVMDAVREFAERGGLVLGICNGFQILCEAGLLPGALMVNASLRFACHFAHVRVEAVDTPFTWALSPGAVLRIPIAHHQGNFQPDVTPFQGRVLFRYCDAEGHIVPAANPNGSWEAVAGIANGRGNVVGMMPHPERCSEAVLGATDGVGIFRSLLCWWEEVGGYDV